MSNFEDIIKNKVEHFDVPYNEAHWDILDNKLTSLKRAKMRKNLLISSAVVIIAALSIIVLLPKETKTNHETKVVENAETANGNEISTLNKKEEVIINKLEQNNSHESQDQVNIAEKVTLEIKKDDVAVDQKSTNKNNESNYNKATPIVVDKVSADFIVYNNKVCLGEEVVFEATDKNDLLSYNWDFGDGNTSNNANPKYIYKKDGIFTVQLKIVNKRNGEEFVAVQKNIVTINPLPNADFTYVEKSTQFDDNKLKYPKTYFNYTGSENDKCSWMFGNGKTSNENNPAIIFDKKGEYTVTLSSKNKFGCSKSITKTVEILTPFELFAPTAFTPNFDGNNDEFLPEAFTTWDLKFEMIIKNKQGNVVFKTTDKNVAWKGSLNNQGSTLEQGVYFWQIVTYDVEGNPYQHFGKINLIK